MSLITARLWEVISSDVKYPLCFISAMVIRLISVLFSVYMLLWIGSFVSTGYLADENESLSIYRRITMISMILTGVLLPVIGHLADKTPSKVIIPIASSGVVLPLCLSLLKGLTRLEHTLVVPS